ncbi:MAG: M20/M25/M40 family metallo-hydrolase [Syntrophorhabdaceae bacterium]|nr:M20/M25/M40 family metallo-hydrolase [Syntrophorhabdaceae bacterium]
MAERDYVVKLLTDFIRINTTNPPGNEEDAVAFLEDILRKEGLETQVYLPVKKRANLISRIKGKEKGRPVILLGHIDVVPANPDEWEVNPFSGDVKDGYIYGRGTIDMKSQVICHLLAFIELKKKDVIPERDIIFLATCDEEVGGQYGVEFMLNEVKDLKDASFVLSEGGCIIEEDGFVHAQIAVAEKKLSQFKIKAYGKSGHGSMPTKDSANEKIIKACNSILSYDWPVKVTGIVNTYLTGIFKGKGLKDFQSSSLKEALKDKKFRRSIEDNPLYNALIKNTVTLTILKSGEKINVIPSESEAYFDARLLPQEDREAFMKKIERLCGRDIKIERISSGSSDPIPSPYKTSYFTGIKKVLERSMGNIPVLPSLLTGASDLRYFRNLGIPSYGFFPVVLSKEDVVRMHGKDERIPIQNFCDAIDRTHEIVQFLANYRG